MNAEERIAKLESKCDKLNIRIKRLESKYAGLRKENDELADIICNYGVLILNIQQTLMCMLSEPDTSDTAEESIGPEYGGGEGKLS